MKGITRTTTELEAPSSSFRLLLTREEEASSSELQPLFDSTVHVPLSPRSELKIKAWSTHITIKSAGPQVKALLIKMFQSGLFAKESLDAWIEGFSSIEADDFHLQSLALAMLILQLLLPKLKPLLLSQEQEETSCIEFLMECEEACLGIVGLLVSEDPETFVDEMDQFLQERDQLIEEGAYKALATDMSNAAFQTMLEMFYEKMKRRFETLAGEMQQQDFATRSIANEEVSATVEKINRLTIDLTKQTEEGEKIAEFGRSTALRGQAYLQRKPKL